MACIIWYSVAERCSRSRFSTIGFRSFDTRTLFVTFFLVHSVPRVAITITIYVPHNRRVQMVTPMLNKYLFKPGFSSTCTSVNRCGRVGERTRAQATRIVAYGVRWNPFGDVSHFSPGLPPLNVLADQCQTRAGPVCARAAIRCPARAARRMRSETIGRRQHARNIIMRRDSPLDVFAHPIIPLDLAVAAPLDRLAICCRVRSDSLRFEKRLSYVRTKCRWGERSTTADDDAIETRASRPVAVLIKHQRGGEA
jgi:hypothetical protein